MPIRRSSGVKEFGAYTLVIDARSPHEYAEDHIPNAINLPVVDDVEFAEVGITYAKDPHAAYLIGAEHSLRNIAKHVRTHISHYSSNDRFLVYCFSGRQAKQGMGRCVEHDRLPDGCAGKADGSDTEVG